jgi:Phospholipase_D-nuclease N-terminal
MVIAADYPFLDILWTMFVFFGFVLWISLLFKVFGDLFRRDDISGWGKFGWSMFMIVVPLLGVLSYLIAQGKEMAQRDLERSLAQKAAFDAYIRETAAGNGGAGDEQIKQPIAPA